MNFLPLKTAWALAASHGKVILLTEAGTIFSAGAAFLLGRPHFAWGLAAGGILSCVNLLALDSLTQRVLSLEGRQGKIWFWIQQVFRWFLSALAIWLLLRISVECLAGALAAYGWFLLALTALAWRSAPTSRRDRFSPK